MLNRSASFILPRGWKTRGKTAAVCRKNGKTRGLVIPSRLQRVSSCDASDTCSLTRRDWKKVTKGRWWTMRGENGVVLEKSPACNYSPDFLLLAESSPQGCSRVLVFLILLFVHSPSSPFPLFSSSILVTIHRRLQVQVAIRQGFI